MITNQKIDIGDVSFSPLSQTLTFTVAANLETIQTVEDICGSSRLSPEEIAAELGKFLESAILINYSRGGMRIKY